MRGVLIRGRALPFVQRYVAGTVFIGLGVVAATASAGHSVTAAEPMLFSADAWPGIGLAGDRRRIDHGDLSNLDFVHRPRPVER